MSNPPIESISMGGLRVPSFVAPLILLLLFSCKTYADWNLTPYVGVDMQYHTMDFKTGFGDNFFSHHQPQANIYFGTTLHNYFGIEAGFQSTNQQNTTATLITGDPNLGTIIQDPNSLAKYNVTSYIRGSHLNVTGFLPLSVEYQIKLIGLIGVASLKAKFQRLNTSLVYFGVVQPTLSPDEFIQRKTVLRLGAGLEHFFVYDWGVRGTLIWENTGKIVAPTEFSPQFVKPKNSFTYGLGAFVSF
jgi:hypothetical protein